MRLEGYFWEALEEIGKREGLTLSEFLTELDEDRGTASLTAFVRFSVLEYFREAATDDGHVAVGHGSLHVVQRSSTSGNAIERAKAKKQHTPAM